MAAIGRKGGHIGGKGRLKTVTKVEPKIAAEAASTPLEAYRTVLIYRRPQASVSVS
jgi:hypothetical protein